VSRNGTASLILLDFFISKIVKMWYIKQLQKAVNFQHDNLQALSEPEDLSFKIAFIISLDSRQVANSVIHKYGTQ